MMSRLKRVVMTPVVSIPRARGAKSRRREFWVFSEASPERMGLTSSGSLSLKGLRNTNPNAYHLVRER
jgi:hypothetical protein